MNIFIYFYENAPTQIIITLHFFFFFFALYIYIYIYFALYFNLNNF